MSEYSIETNSLTKAFGSFTAVDNVSFFVKKREIFGFLGPNGAGKSTTIRMLCGILECTSGTGLVEGFNINTESEKIKEIIGYMSQRFSLYNDMTVQENIEFFGGIHNVGRKVIEERKKWILEMAGLKGKEKTLTKFLSGGWKQRLALGCALVHSPKVLFLDEPSAGVDPISRRDFWNLIRSISKEGTTVFVTTHYMDEVENCDRLSLIYAGSLIAIGSPAELKAQNNVESIEKLFVKLIRGYKE